MPDPTITEALEEAYASAPVSRAIIDTMSVTYAGLVDDEGQPAEIWCYQGYTGDRTSPEGVPLKDFRIETDADIRPGEVVEFVAIPFSVTMPHVASQATVKGQIVIDGVGREIADALMDAVALGSSIVVTYRAYLEGMELDGPQNDPPLRFGLANVSMSATQVRGDITLPNIGNRRFPGEVYRSSRFPALR